MDIYDGGKFISCKRQNVILNQQHWKLWKRFSKRVKAQTKINTYKDPQTKKRLLQLHGSKGTNTTLVVSQSEKDVTANRDRYTQ